MRASVRVIPSRSTWLFSQLDAICLGRRMSSVDVVSFRRFVVQCAEQSRSSSLAYLLDLGLRLHDPSRPSGYSSTPTNSLTFAATGGNGVHFGILRIATAPNPNDGPVVM